MYFDFEDYHPDIQRVGPALTHLEVVLLSIIFHLVLLLTMILLPRYYPELFETHPIQLVQAQPDETPMRYVFVDPKNDVLSPKPPERGPASDADRMARSPQPKPDASNLAPYMRGNTPEPVEKAPDDAARGRGPVPEPKDGQDAAQPADDPNAGQADAPRVAEGQSKLTLPDSLRGRSATSGGQLGDALRNLQRYVQQDTFENPQGGGQFGPEIQFDTKGVEFGPWVRRFVAQVKRNWLIPYSAMSMSGHVVITFNVHKDGSLTDLMVVGPSGIEAFNNAAYGALASSNPTQPLPPEYPADKAFFTVTFFYNEQPR